MGRGKKEEGGRGRTQREDEEREECWTEEGGGGGGGGAMNGQVGSRVGLLRRREGGGWSRGNLEWMG